MGLAAAGAGMLGAMGLGGGSLLLLYLGTLELGQRAAQGINLVFILPVGLAGLWFHRKNKLIDTRLLLPLLAGGMVGILLGSVTAGLLPESLLRRAFGLLLLCIGGKEIFTGCKM